MKIESSIVLYRNRVTIYFKHSKSTLRHNTGIIVNDEKQFNQIVKRNISFIQPIKRMIDDLIVEAINNNCSNRVEYIKSKLDKQQQLVDGEVAANNLNLVDMYQKFYDDVYKNDNTISDNTKETWLTGLTDFKEFTASQTKYKKIVDIDDKFVITVQKYFQNKLNEDGTRPKYTGRTIKKKLQCFSKFVRHYDELIDISVVNKNQNIKTKAHQTEVVTFDDVEFDFLKNYQAKTSKEQDTIDMTIIMCATGLNIGDMFCIQKEFIRGGVLEFSRSKSKANVKIPLNKLAVDILEKHNYNMNLMSDQVYNIRLRNILQSIDIFNCTFSYKSPYTGLYIFEPKYKLLSSKSCRKYFITKCIQTNLLSLDQLIIIVGHKNINQIKFYMSKVLNVDKVRSVLDTF